MKPISNPRWRSRQGMNATRGLALSFGGLILLGTLLLMLPGMSRGSRSLFTAFFTAASATCVTGFTLADTVTQWTTGGQAVLLLLIQVGGLGFMLAYSLLLVLLHRKIALSQRLVLASSLGLKNTGGVVRVVRHSLEGTVLLEGVGTILLAFRFVPLYGWGQGLWRSLFHSVSAFCNAGFDLIPGGSGLAAFREDPYVLLIHCALSVVGGIGFFVWEDICLHRRWGKLSLYSRLAIGTTVFLLLLGWGYFLLAEWSNPNTLGALTPGGRVLDAFFQSVNLRTAGFTVFDQGGLTEGAQGVCLLFMLVGGSSGSTACGIKTVTLVVLAAALRSGLQGREQVVIHGRTIPRSQVMRAITLTMTVVGMAFLGGVVLTHLQGGELLPRLFQSMAAIGTVGLSTAPISDLSLPSLWVVLALMYLGRVGILSFSLAFLTRSGAKDRVQYPSCEVMIG